MILPTVHVANLASHVLSLGMKGLADDWTERYGYAPVLAETFVDPSRFAGLLSGSQLETGWSNSSRTYTVSKWQGREGSERYLCISDAPQLERGAVRGARG
jgi:hypothetical protein